MKLIRADLHVHTKYSMDCDTPLEKIIDRCQKLGIQCIAVADHGTAEGALRLQQMAPFKVIVAEEILTPYGEIMGMFLKETIPTNISPEDAIYRIRAQDGLVNLPHPFDALRGSALVDSEHPREDLIPQIDLIEILNARAVLRRTAVKAEVFARKYNIPGGAGSDAHTLREIGRAFVEMPEFTGKSDFIENLKKGRICGQRSSPLVHFNSTWTKIKKRI